MKSQIEILLGEWGRWKRGENRTGLGYPSRSAFQQMRVDGDRAAEVDVALVDDDVRSVDSLVELLHPQARAVLTAHYVRPGAVKTKLDTLRMTRTAYYDCLDFAHQFLGHNWANRAQTKVSGHIARVSG